MVAPERFELPPPAPKAGILLWVNADAFGWPLYYGALKIVSLYLKSLIYYTIKVINNISITTTQINQTNHPQTRPTQNQHT